MEANIRLTESVSCAGCAAKLDPSLLKQVTSLIQQSQDPRVLVGFDKADDAGVFKLSEDLALVQTLDFFTPIVDDPYTFGKIAATNSLSDVYAMGGKPLTALNILCYNEDLGPEVLGKILKGGNDQLEAANCALLGGHSVRDKELKFGMSITGLVNPIKVFTNAGAKAGDLLVFTKKLGTGIVTTAAKKGQCPKAILDEAISQMCTLNDVAAEVMKEAGAHACTDVTGFSFLGHLSEMTRASGVSARVYATKVPRFSGVEALIEAGHVTRGDRTNRKYAAPLHFKVQDPALESLLFDPQTSGGLLIALPEAQANHFLNAHPSWLVGEILDVDPAGSIAVAD